MFQQRFSSGWRQRLGAHPGLERFRLSALLLSLCAVGLSACGTAATRVAPSLAPIAVPTFESTKPIAFRKIVIKIPRHRPIGGVSIGIFCINRGEMTVSGGRYELDADQFNDIFRTELQQANYNIVGDPDALFEDPDIRSAEYFIAGLIEDIEANVCYPWAGYGNYSSSSAEVYMEVEWQIFDTLSREVVTTLHTSGSFDVDERFNGLDYAFDEAFALAARNLLADRQFYELVRTENPDNRSGASSEPSEIRSPSFSLNAEGADKVEGVDVARLGQAVAIVRSALGHGSGFVVGQGLLVTNEHVVGGAEKVRLIFGDGAQIDATVAVVDSRRDVALVRFADSFIRPSLSVRTTPAEIGADVYSFGAPLAEEYAGTLSKGIVSARREIRGLNYIQSDVTINRGSSGGPLIDGDGTVVGISVSGVFYDGVGQQGINFFIPIEEAITALGL